MQIEEADNIVKFVPKKNQFNPLRIVHTCEIDCTDAELEYQYTGVCVDKKGMEYFSTVVFSHDIRDISEMEWYGYDLKHDPERKNKIAPKLKTPKGGTKRVVFPFQKRVEYNEICSYMTHQKVKNSVRETGKDYYVSTVLYKGRPIHDYKVVLKFHKVKPERINVYSVKNQTESYLYELVEDNMTQEGDVYIYTDNIKGETAWSIRVYVFDRKVKEESK